MRGSLDSRSSIVQRIEPFTVTLLRIDMYWFGVSLFHILFPPYYQKGFTILRHDKEKNGRDIALYKAMIG